MGKLAGKSALVTGGGRGIGRGIVLEFAREGADVAINYRRDRDAAERTADEVRALGRRAIVLAADVGDREAVEAMVARAVEFLGHLDVAVANSGVAARVATVAEVDPAEWRRVLATDLDGAFWTARTAISHVVARRGAFLFISSIGADTAAEVRRAASFFFKVIPRPGPTRRSAAHTTGHGHRPSSGRQCAAPGRALRPRRPASGRRRSGA